ncbi:MAG: ABC transporter ATP-binding protein [Myxacorys chilensis ATA2-1-KO14]|jgi:ABC-2 type transport system ATP-binding protein|nr:ABC transporter ATP-binding protein [Myxacorys chilensis ATA2-1-KO14]
MIEVEHLSKIYGSTPAIEDVTFSVAPGEILGFLGPNGAGKTTTMRILSGYLPASRGTAKVAGFEVHEHSMEVRQRIGYLPETPPLYPEMTVEGFLNFVAQIKGVSAGDRADRIKAALEKCNLVEKRKTLIRKLSKGFRQRVGIAQAIVHDPPVIILDEPTVGLDPRQIIDVRNLIKQLANDHTVILSTHILPEVSMTCDRVAIINRGRVVATNTPALLMEQLMGGSGYELDIAGNSIAVQQCLERVEGVKHVEEMQIENLPENRIKVRVVSESNAEPGHAIAAALVRNGLGLYEMRRVQASLEDVFLELTTEEKPLEATPETADTTDNVDTEPPSTQSEVLPTETPSEDAR